MPVSVSLLVKRLIQLFSDPYFNPSHVVNCSNRNMFSTTIGIKREIHVSSNLGLISHLYPSASRDIHGQNHYVFQLSVHPSGVRLSIRAILMNLVSLESFNRFLSKFAISTLTHGWTDLIPIGHRLKVKIML